MYDDEEEIRRKRRNLILIIIVIIAIIVLLLFLLLFKTSSKGKTKTSLECSLKVVSADKDSDGNYSGNVVVGFDTATPESDIVKKNVGIQESSRNKETYTVNKVGTVTVKGFVYNTKGEVQTCSLQVTVSSPKGGCKLRVDSGTEGENGWYKSDVSVKLDTVETGSLTITKYNLTKKDEQAPENSNDSYSVSAEGTTDLVGTIEYSNGNKATCNMAVKIDKTKPECKLKVISGESNGDGSYTGDVKVGFESFNDSASGVGLKGFGTKDDFSKETFAITQNGTKEVTGYVKDKAGHLNTCTLSVTKKAKSEGGNGGNQGGSGGSGGNSGGSGGNQGGGSSGGGNSGYVPSGSSVVSSNNGSRMCELMVSGDKINDSFYTAVVVSFRYVNQGLVSSNVNVDGRNDPNYVTINKPSDPASYVATGTVTYDNGKTVTCQIGFVIDPSKDTVNYFKDHAVPGQYVNYNPGNWGATVNVGGDGTFGGYTYGSSKNSSVFCKDAIQKSPLSGWVVYETGNQVKIVHAGVPICMNHTDSHYSSALSKINNHSNAAQFKDGTFAADAYYMTYQDFSNMAYRGGPKRAGELYYLAGENTANGYALGSMGNDKNYMWGTDGDNIIGHKGEILGVRPIVVLKANVGAYAGNNMWNLELVNRDITEDDTRLGDRVNDKISSAISEVESLYH